MKGVLFCHRPDATPTRAPSSTLTHSFHQGFNVEVVHPCGRDPGQKDRAHFTPSAAGVVGRWDARLHLSQLLERRLALAVAVEECRVRKEARQARLCAESRLLQGLVRSGEGGERGGLTWAQAQEAARAIVKADAQHSKCSPPPILPPPAFLLHSLGGEYRPAWARSGEDQQKMEEEECKDIVDFVQGLDADKYLTGLEDHAETQLALKVLRRVEDEISSFSAVPPPVISSPSSLPLVVSTPPCSISRHPVSILGSTEDEDNPFKRQQGVVWREGGGGGVISWGERGSEEEGGGSDCEEDEPLLAMPLVDKALSSNVALRSIHSKKSLANFIEGLGKSGALG